MEWTQVISAISGATAVLLGIAVAEFLRRRSRVEQFAETVFGKRLTAYEELLSVMIESNRIALDIMQNDKLSASERHDLISNVISDIAEHVTENQLFIDEELASHCVALFMGVEDVHEGPERQTEIEMLRHSWNDTVRMIREDAGVAKVDRLLREINRPHISSPVIERIRELKRERSRSQ